MTKVSVIIPIYNVERYLEDCMRSIVGQTISDIEIICIDDGSTDNSLKIIKKYETLLGNRLKIISQSNKGVSEARNLGLKLAHGDFVVFIDPDDWVELDMLETMYEQAKQNHSDIVECNIIEHLENRTKIRKLKLNLRLWFKFNILHNYNYSWHDIKNVLFKVRAYSVNRLYKKNFLLKNKIMYPNFGGEDFYFVIDSVLSASEITYINKPFYHYRKRKDSLSSGNGHVVKNNQEIGINDVIECMKNILIKHGVYEGLKPQFDNWIVELCFNIWQGNNVKTRLLCQDILDEVQQQKLESKIQNNGNKFLECLFSVKSEILQGTFYKKISFLGYRWYLKIKG